MKPSGSRFAVLLWACAGLCAAILLPTSLAQAQQRPVMTRHVREATVNGKASLVGSIPGTQQMHLAIMLPLSNQAELNDLLRALYDPHSPSYRRYLGVQEFTERFGPAQEDYDAVISFAKANGMTVAKTAANRLVLEVTGSVANINKAFHLTMGMYQHPTENRRFYAPDREPTVDLSVRLWHIAGLDNFSMPHALYQKAAPGSELGGNTTGSGPSGNFLGSDRRAAYYGGSALTGSGQAIGLVEFDGYSLSDVQAYFTNAGQPLNVPINNVLLDGANADSDGDDTEQVIDIVEAISMAPALSQLRVYIAPSSTLPIFGGDGDVLIFNAMATDNIAKQLSESWNWSPADPTADNPIFQEFAAQGQSFLQASGDFGAYDAIYPYHFPQEDPNVTAVGGTNLTTNGSGGAWESEIAWGGANTACSANTGSGGGPSPDGIAIPSYQQLAGVINSSNEGSTTLRNVPDVAAEGNCDNYFCANGVCSEGLGGTSLAAPTWAGFIALVNEQNAANGQSTEGFLNPGIYSTGLGSSYASFFHDITVGDNFNGDSPSLFSAVTGYDLVTGWGSPVPTGWLAPPASPGLFMTLTPTSISMTQGTSATVSVEVFGQGGFSGSVNLTLPGLPTGVTVTFSPSTVTVAAGGTGVLSTLTLTASATSTTGIFSEDVFATATSGSVDTDAPLSLSVALAPNFSVSVAQTSLALTQSSSVSDTVTVSSVNGFTSATSLTISGLPSGVTASFAPASVTPTSGSPASSTLTLTATSTAATGSFPLTITGTSGSISHSASVTLAVSAKQSSGFTIAVAPSSVMVTAGGTNNTATSTVTISSQGSFSAATGLSISGLPTGVSATFSPASVMPAAGGSAKSTLTLVASSTAKAGNSTLTVQGTSGSLQQSVSLSLTVSSSNNPAPSISSISPSSVLAGGAAFTLTVNGSGFVSTSVVNMQAPNSNGSISLPTTFVSASELTAQVSASQIASSGDIGIFVTNPSPGGGTSNTKTLDVQP